MSPIKIIVDENKIINYKTRIAGIIQRAELIDCNDGYHELYDADSRGWGDKWYVDGSTSYGSFETINYTYRLSDNKLLIRQRCSNGYSGNILGMSLKTIPTGESGRITYCSGKVVKYYTTAGEHNKTRPPEYQLPVDDNTIIADMYGSPFVSKRPLSQQELDAMGFKITNTNHGTQVSAGSTYFNDSVYMLFGMMAHQYKEYDDSLSSGSYANYQTRPTADEIATAIDKRSLLEWYEKRDAEVEFGYRGVLIKDDGYTKWYVNYEGTHSMYDYHNLDPIQKTLPVTTNTFWGDSQINVVLDYYKADDVSVDTENINQYSIGNIQAYDYNYDYNPDGSSTTDVFYKNYCTFLSAKINRDEDWNEEIFNNFQTEMCHRLFEEQLK